MAYDMSAALDRNIRFMTDPDARGVLIRAFEFGAEDIQLPGLYNFSLPGDIRAYCDQLIMWLLRFREARAFLNDDWIPLLKPRLGIAEFSCFLGGEVKYGGDTSYHIHPLNDISDWRSLRLDRSQPHYAALLDGMAYLKEKGKEYGFFASLRGVDGPMDIANAVRGNELFYDFYDNPEETKAFLNMCAEAAFWNHENQRKLATDVMGGMLAGMDVWMPGNAIGHISEDATCLCSPETYLEFGLPYTKKLVDRYDFAVLHVHSLGRKLIPLFRQMEKIRVFQLSPDPNQPSSIETYREYADALEGTTVIVDMTAQEFWENLDFLKGRRSIVHLLAPSKQEALEIVETVRGTDMTAAVPPET